MPLNPTNQEERRMIRIGVLGLAGLLTLSASTATADTVSCNSKHGWQRAIVVESVHDWFTQEPPANALLELVQAEHGIVACSSSPSLPARLHTTTLPHGLERDRLGALLLANELEWSGLIPAPGKGLAGEVFRVRGGSR